MDKTAKYLIAYQNYAIAGGKSKPFNFNDSTLTRGYGILLSGENLFQTLILNLTIYNQTQPGKPLTFSENDKPIWEQDDNREPNKKGNIPYGYLDYLTWQGRRINLIKKGDKISQIKILQGLVVDKNVIDPAKSYKKIKKKGFISRKIDAERAIWRDYYSLLEFSNNDNRRPLIFNTIWKVDENYPEIFKKTHIGLDIIGIGYGDKAGKINLWQHISLPFDYHYASDKKLLNKLKDIVDLLEKVGELFTAGNKKEKVKKPFRVFTENIQNRESDKNDFFNKVEETIRTLGIKRAFWSKIEIPFLNLIQNLKDDYTLEDGERTYGEKTLPYWRKELHAIAINIFKEIMNPLYKSPRLLKAIVYTEEVFSFQLNSKLK